MATESHVMNQSSNQADQAVKNSHLPSKKFSSCFFESESSSIFIKTVNSDIRQDRTPIFRLYCITGSKVEARCIWSVDRQTGFPELEMTEAHVERS